MNDILKKLSRNIRAGTFFKNVPVAVRNRVLNYVNTHNLFYRFDEERVLMKEYEKGIQPIDQRHRLVGNYYVDVRLPLTKDSIVYSAGVLTDIRFDEELHKLYKCPVFLFDPTPVAIEFMETKKEKEYLRFFPFGVWKEEATLKFFSPQYGGSASVLSGNEEGEYFEAPCYTVAHLMRQNNHENLALFKADIEGAALPVLQQMITDGVFPEQIVVEFERPRKDLEAVQRFIQEVSQLREDLSERGYEEFLIPRQHAKYFSLEMLFVKI